MQMQQKVQQQTMHPMQTCIFLPSAPMGVPEPYETSKKSLTAGTDEWECLNREVRAAQALFMHTGRMGKTQMVLMQPVQATGIAELLMLRSQPEELHLRNAGVALKDQVMAQNLIFFMERKEAKATSHQRSCVPACDCIHRRNAGTDTTTAAADAAATATIADAGRLASATNR